MADLAVRRPTGTAPAADPAPRRRAPRPRVPLAPVHHTDGPRVRLGLAWFAGSMAAAVVARPLLALVMAGAAALAADQLVRLRAEDAAAAAGAGAEEAAEVAAASPLRLPVALVAAALPLAALAGTARFTAALPAAFLVVFVHRLVTAPARAAAGPPAPRGAALRDVAHTYGFALAMGTAAAAPVFAHRLGTGVVVVLLVLVAAYDAGDFLIGTGAANAWEGPAAGITSIVVVSFAIGVVALPPLETGHAWVLGGVAILLAPLGPPAASVLIGGGARAAGYVRRLDSLLVLGPVWIWVAAALLAGAGSL